MTQLQFVFGFKKSGSSRRPVIDSVEAPHEFEALLLALFFNLATSERDSGERQEEIWEGALCILDLVAEVRLVFRVLLLSL